MSNNYVKNVLLLIFILAYSMATSAQDIIHLKNPSFESKNSGIPGRVVEDWIGLGPSTETSPDIQPGAFGVITPAQQGKTYVGLVVRDNNTWEGVGQGLDGILIKDSVYSFSIYLARSEQLVSPTKTSIGQEKFNAPAVLKIWGYNKKTKQEELLAESFAIRHPEWTKCSFTLKPTVADFDELDLMAYYAPGFEQQNGNLLVDNCSDIVKVKK